jgi:hypothetical protein
MALPALLAACGFNSGSGSGDGGHGSDSADALVCYGTFIRVCFPAAPTQARTLPTSDIDTDTSELCDQTNDQKARYCVVVGNGFTIAAGQTITARGNRPLVLLSATMFDMSGAIDASSSRIAARKGPGADPADCTSGTPPMVSVGGYGGSFHGKGGNGGDGNPADGSGGAAAEPLSAFPSALRAGCPGGNGVPLGAAGEGTGGSGGGAIAIVAAQLHIDGPINASGAGGRSGASNAKSGGGGGGSGGMIVLDAAALPIQLGSRAKIWANGGGGAQGGADGMGGNGGNESAGPDQAAAATAGSAAGADGGSGSAGLTLTGSNGILDARTGGGGGGGGGGAGFVHAQGVTGLGIISPASLDLPTVPL